jgi:uncharacterized OB-fold protein
MKEIRLDRGQCGRCGQKNVAPATLCRRCKDRIARQNVGLLCRPIIWEPVTRSKRYERD